MSGEAAFLGAIFVSVLLSGFLIWIISRGVDDALNKIKHLKSMIDTLEQMLDIHEQDIKSLESRIKHLKDVVESKK